MVKDATPLEQSPNSDDTHSGSGSQHSDTSVRKNTIRLRLYYDFEKPRSGRQILITAHTDAGLSTGTAGECVPSKASVSTIWEALKSQVDLTTHIPHVYDGGAECFVPLSNLSTESIAAEQYIPTPTDNAYARNQKKKVVPSNKIVCETPRIDIKLIASTQKTNEMNVGEIAPTLICDSSNTSLTSTWFGIGILRGKVNANHGSLWRSALQFGASLTFTIGKRYEKKFEGSADVYKTLRQIPCVPFADIAAFMAMAPVDAKVVVIEYGGEDLIDFKHPKRALYVLGSEDAGIPPALVARAHAHIAIPTSPGRPSSLNVAAAGAIVMYDRFMKLRREESCSEIVSQPRTKKSQRLQDESTAQVSGEIMAVLAEENGQKSCTAVEVTKATGNSSATEKSQAS